VSAEELGSGGEDGEIEVRRPAQAGLPAFFAHADVECIESYGNEAVATGPAREQPGNEAPIPPGSWLVVSVQDNGGPGTDRVRGRLDTPAVAMLSCNTDPPAFPAPVNRGNYTVHDAD
jgi:hypothetical protein